MKGNGFSSSLKVKTKAILTSKLTALKKKAKQNKEYIPKSNIIFKNIINAIIPWLKVPMC